MHSFSMTLENLNKLSFIPTKNYETERLDTGILQLSDGTHLILDESAMKPGSLDANGVKHVQVIFCNSVIFKLKAYKQFLSFNKYIKYTTEHFFMIQVTIHHH